ncbi:MAG: hypothetical protein GXP55_01815 [Deltaproteobacteria bacterium]|nr:hypothetical protein [Deltaproteobacteria bacterium]
MAFGLLFLAYPASYAGLRLTHVLVHSAVFTTEEGYHAHTSHWISAGADVRNRHMRSAIDRACHGFYRPLATLETAYHTLRHP